MTSNIHISIIPRVRAKERPWQLPSSQLLSVQALSTLRTVMSNLLRGGSEIYSQVSQRTKECQFHLGAPRMAFPCGFCAEQPKKLIGEMEE